MPKYTEILSEYRGRKLYLFAQKESALDAIGSQRYVLKTVTFERFSDINELVKAFNEKAPRGKQIDVRDIDPKRGGSA